VTALTRVLRIAPALSAALIVSWPVSAAGQTITAPSVVRQQIVSANPFGLMFGWFNVEFEREMTSSATWGASASWFSLGDDAFDYANGNAIVRYYPSGTVLRGFYLGGRGGVYHVSDEFESAGFFGAGFEIGYSWLLGVNQNIGISLGAGATRLFGSELNGASLTIPTVRLVNVGIAF
jgi:hypothetical protein